MIFISSQTLSKRHITSIEDFFFVLIFNDLGKNSSYNLRCEVNLKLPHLNVQFCCVVVFYVNNIRLKKFIQNGRLLLQKVNLSSLEPSSVPFALPLLFPQIRYAQFKLINSFCKGLINLFISPYLSINNFVEYKNEKR